MRAVAVLGDIHGDLQRMLELVGDLDHEVPLVVVGDYFDRWDHAVEAIQWLMARPHTTALMGNHDALILGVVEERLGGVEGRNTENWQWNGGKDADLERLLREPEVMDWIRNLPAMTMVGDTLIQHCDSPVYLSYGGDLDAINESVRRRANSHDPEVFFHLFADLCKRRQFYSQGTLRQYLDIFHAKRRRSRCSAAPSSTSTVPSRVALGPRRGGSFTGWRPMAPTPPRSSRVGR
jgi:Calcineurin-like phosphoesterase